MPTPDRLRKHGLFRLSQVGPQPGGAHPDLLERPEPEFDDPRPPGLGQPEASAKRLNPQESAAFSGAQSRQTVELRSPDGSSIIHLLLAGIVMAADWAFREDDSLFKRDLPLELADKLYVQGNIFTDQTLLRTLPTLPRSCVESSRILLEKRGSTKGMESSRRASLIMWPGCSRRK